MLPCPACSLGSPAELMCRHDSPVCDVCCPAEHGCPDCKGRGSIRIRLRVPGVGREQRDITCASCESTGNSQKETSS